MDAALDKNLDDMASGLARLKGKGKDRESNGQTERQSRQTRTWMSWQADRQICRLRGRKTN